MGAAVIQAVNLHGKHKRNCKKTRHLNIGMSGFFYEK